VTVFLDEHRGPGCASGRHATFREGWPEVRLRRRTVIAVSLSRISEEIARPQVLHAFIGARVVLGQGP
jgi:hypothetical protein